MVWSDNGAEDEMREEVRLVQRRTADNVLRRALRRDKVHLQVWLVASTARPRPLPTAQEVRLLGRWRVQRSSHLQATEKAATQR